MWKKVLEILSAVGGAVASFFVNMPPLVWILIAVMSIDYVTGLICGAMGKSKKTENGYLASHEAWKGLMKKARSFTICIQKTFILRLPFLIIRVVYWLGYREMDQIGEIF